MPYAQIITQLIKEYEIDDITIAKPCYETVSKLKFRRLT
jgi:hypothetical protein